MMEDLNITLHNIAEQHRAGLTVGSPIIRRAMELHDIAEQRRAGLPIHPLAGIRRLLPPLEPMLTVDPAMAPEYSLQLDMDVCKPDEFTWGFRHRGGQLRHTNTYDPDYGDRTLRFEHPLVVVTTLRDGNAVFSAGGITSIVRQHGKLTLYRGTSAVVIFALPMADWLHVSQENA